MNNGFSFGLILLAVESALCLAQDDGRYHATAICTPIDMGVGADGRYYATAPEPVVSDPPKVDDRPEVWLFTADYCTWCHKAKDEIEPVWGELPFRIVYKTEVPDWLDGYVETLPTAYWVAGKSGKTLKGWRGLKVLKSAWLATMPKAQVPQAEKPKPKLAAVFGPTYYEDRHNTTVGHLTGHHHVPYDVVAPYVNNPSALNQIHGAVHTGMVRY